MALKYRYTVDFVDGTTFDQPKDDVSTIDPKRSAFYDVLQSKVKVKRFTLKRLLERYSVDLLTGTFKINGVEVIPEPVIDKKTGKELVVIDRKLIWYMNVQKHFNATYSTIKGSLLKMDNLNEERIFYFGWETTIKGKNYKRVIGVK